MKKRFICLIAFVLMISICQNLYATEGLQGEVVTEDMQFLDEIHPDDLDIGQVIEEQEQEQKSQNDKKINQYTVCIMVIFGINIIDILRKIGLNRRIFAVIFGTIGGILISSIGILLANQLKIIDMSINQYYMAVATFGINLYVSYKMVVHLMELKSKTEDISWKKLFKNGMSIGKENIINLVNMLFFVNVGCGMLFLNTKIITKEMIGVALVQSISVIINIIITNYIFSIFNCKKTIYKTTSNNKLEGKRSLKL